MSILELKNVNYEDRDQKVLDNINLHIESGDFVLLVGPSGSGKSSLLKIINNLHSVSQGQVIFAGDNINDINPIELRRRISYCLQTPIFFGDRVKDDMDFVFETRGIKPDESRIKEVLALFKLDESYLSKQVINLSGGEKQRLSLVRSLLFMPEILLLDEVTSALDEDNAIILEEAIKDLNEKGLTVIWISHQVDKHKRLANKIVSLEEGRLVNVEVLS